MNLQQAGYYFFLIKFFLIVPFALFFNNSLLGVYGCWCGILALIIREGLKFTKEGGKEK